MHVAAGGKGNGDTLVQPKDFEILIIASVVRKSYQRILMIIRLGLWIARKTF